MRKWRAGPPDQLFRFASLEFQLVEHSLHIPLRPSSRPMRVSVIRPPPIFDMPFGLLCPFPIFGPA